MGLSGLTVSWDTVSYGGEGAAPIGPWWTTECGWREILTLSLPSQEAKRDKRGWMLGWFSPLLISFSQPSLETVAEILPEVCPTNTPGFY